MKYVYLHIHFFLNVCLHAAAKHGIFLILKIVASLFVFFLFKFELLAINNKKKCKKTYIRPWNFRKFLMRNTNKSPVICAFVFTHLVLAIQSLFPSRHRQDSKQTRNSTTWLLTSKRKLTQKMQKYTHFQKKWHHRHKCVGCTRQVGQVSDTVKPQWVVASCGEQPVNEYSNTYTQMDRCRKDMQCNLHTKTAKAMFCLWY